MVYDLITVLGTLILGAGITPFFYCKCENAPTLSKTLSIFWHKENPKVARAMLLYSLQQVTGDPKIKAAAETIKKLEKLKIGFSDFDKCTIQRNSKDLIKMVTTSV